MAHQNDSVETSFAIYEVTSQPSANPDIAAFFIESTASTNVNIAFTADSIDDLDRLQTQEGIDRIADHLAARPNSEIVVTVHGFSSPMKLVLDRYGSAFAFVNSDATIQATGKRTVCIGYRWPSESIGQPLSTFLSAVPPFLLALFWFGVALLAVAIGITAILIGNPHLAVAIAAGLSLTRAVCACAGLMTLAIPAAVFLERTAVYFRDGYRAAEYGVPDLVEVIRQIDNALSKRGVDGAIHPVGLSFIGHSMGAFVVTSAVRILTDVFSPESIAPLPGSGPNTVLAAGTVTDSQLDSHIGHALTLNHLVLVAADIPGEALLTCRANFLRSSLRRFKEAYLFSNAGDAILRLVSSVANSFSFPTTSNRYGYRLGNTQILPLSGSPHEFHAKASREMLLSWLIVGVSTLGELQTVLGAHEREALNRSRQNHPLPSQTDSLLPEKFTYFDCTDYRDRPRNAAASSSPASDASGQNRGWIPYLSFAKGPGRLSQWTLVRLLLQYIFRSQEDKIDVHSGYFDGDFTQALIYRLACLGWSEALCAPDFGGSVIGSGTGPTPDEVAFGAVCKQHGIAVLRPL